MSLTFQTSGYDEWQRRAALLAQLVLPREHAP
jgi:hypothetical protein